MHAQPLSAVFYRPIDAAIRWAGLLRFRQDILEAAHKGHLPPTLDCPRCCELRLYTDRIYDAIVHGELPYGANGITTNDKRLWNSPNLTVRHVDLKHWMLRTYPDQRPAFLFSRSERLAHPVITVDSAHALLVEREALRTELELCRRRLHDLMAQRLDANDAGETGQRRLSDRGESTYLNIIGAMVVLMLGNSPSGNPYSSFHTQEAIITALVASQGNLMGITERTLQTKFAEARRKLRAAIT